MMREAPIELKLKLQILKLAAQQRNKTNYNVNSLMATITRSESF